VRLAHFLYYWRRYGENIATGPIYKLNQNSRVMLDIREGDTVWAIARPVKSRYALVARFEVTSTGSNPYGSTDYAEYGEFFFTSERAGATYYSTVGNDVEPLVRSSSLRSAAKYLGQSFQGSAGVRQLAAADSARLVSLASTLRHL